MTWNVGKFEQTFKDYEIVNLIGTKLLNEGEIVLEHYFAILW